MPEAAWYGPLRADVLLCGTQFGLNVRRHVDALETELVLSALEKTGGNQTRAAELLGLSRFGLQKMMKRLEIAARRPALRRLSSRLSDAG